MGKKINLNPIFILGLFVVGALFFYYPIFFNKIPFNGNLLVSFWFPWIYEKWFGFPAGVPAKFLGVDEIREFIPLFSFTYESLRSGFLPFWNPYNFSGTPHLANWATGVFYAPYISIFLLTKTQAIIFFKISAIVFSGFFTYLYLRSLNLNKLSSFFGGFTFAFSAAMLIWAAEFWQSVHSVLWLPLILFAVERIIQTGRVKYLVLAGFGSALSVMAGYTQTTIYVYLLSFTYALFRLGILKFNFWQEFPLRNFLMIISAFLLGLGFSAIHIIPAFEFFLLSPRKEIALTSTNLDFLLPIKQILTFFVPDIFGHIATQNWFLQGPGQYYEKMIYFGVVPLVFASFAFFLKRLRGQTLFFLIWGILTLSTVFDLPTSRLFYQAHIPFLSTAIAIRVILLTTFSFSVLSAIGLSWWFEASKKEKRKLVVSLLPLIIIYASISAWLLWSYFQKSNISNFPPNWFTVSIRNFVIPGTVFISTVILSIAGSLWPNLKRVFWLFLVLIMLIHSFIFAQKYFAFSSPHFFYPSHPLIAYLKENLGLFRFWGYGEAALDNNFATVYQIFSAEGYDPVNIKRYNELLSAANDGELKGIASRSDALIPRTDIYPNKDINPFRLKILDFLGVKFVGYYNSNPDKVKASESNHFVRVWQNDGFVIFQNKKAFSRVFLVPEVLYADSSKEAIKMVLDPQIDLSKKVILEEKVVMKKTGGVPQGETQITQYLPNKVFIKATTNIPQFLILTDNFYPAWEAAIDGKPVKIYSANYTFRAVLVTPGEHEVIFEYNSKTFKFGALVSLFSLTMASLVLIASKIRLKYNIKE